VTRQRAKGNTRASTSEPAAKAVKVFTSTGKLERKRKAEDGTTEEVAQLKELVYRLLKSQKDQETIRDTPQEKLLAAIEAQAKTIAKLEITIQGQTKELGEIRTQLRSEKPGRLSYSDTLRRAPSSVRSTITTLVSGIMGSGLVPGVNKDRTAITINTARVKKEKQDTTVMREILNRSLASFKVTEHIAIKYIRLRPTDSADLVFSSAKDRDWVREHPRWLTTMMPEARIRSD
jgi:hypothetical protein